MQPFPFTPWMWRDMVRETVDDPAAAHDRPDTGVVGYDVEAVDGSIGKIDQDNAKVPADRAASRPRAAQGLG